MADSKAHSGTPDDLGDIFRRLIRNQGPISVAQFMGESNARYYAAKNPLGREGDFVTAPDISQMFGELIGLWLADIWIRSGRPEPIMYVELGPGRGTLARDALRTAAKYGMDAEVHLVEASPALREVQLDAVPGAVFHPDLSTVPYDGPLLIVANEFLDALPVRQLVKTQSGWRERMVGLSEDDGFVFIAGDQPMESAVPQDRRSSPVGTLIETCPGAAANVYEAAGRLADQGGAALFIDYGYAQVQDGSTLQAVARHQQVDPLTHPGTADLTALVDFATLAKIAQSRGVRWQGTVTQGDWLRALGIAARTAKLSEAAPHHAAELEQARDRLIAEDQMGSLFKVMGLAGPDWADGAAF